MKTINVNGQKLTIMNCIYFVNDAVKGGQCEGYCLAHNNAFYRCFYLIDFEGKKIIYTQEFDSFIEALKAYREKAVKIMLS